MLIKLHKSHHSWPMRLVSFFILISFTISLINFPGRVYGQNFPMLPVPGVMVPLSAGFNPAMIRGIKIFPNDPFRFDFIVDAGQSKLADEALRNETNKLIKYFLASLTVPEKDLWVNLSPYEKDRIIPDKFGVTEMGRDLLAQDYILKQLTASLMYPEKDLGKEFWDRVNKKLVGNGLKPFPTTETFSKVWIVPEKAVVYEYGDMAFVVESRLKVMLEDDYLAQEKLEARSQRLESITNTTKATSATQIETEIIKEILIPAIEQEVNEGKNFAALRQIYQSHILATWFKRNLKQSVLAKAYVDQNKVTGVDIEDKDSKQKIYEQYLEAFKKGVYNYIKEDYDSATQEVIPRKYFSGGTELALSNETYRAERIPENPASKNDRAMLRTISGVLDSHAYIASAALVNPNEKDRAMSADEGEPELASNKLPEIKLAGGGEGPVNQFWMTLGLDNVEVVDHKVDVLEKGLEVYRVKLPGINRQADVPQGIEIFREFIDAKYWERFESDYELNILFKNREDGTKELLAILPVLNDRLPKNSISSFYDLTEFNIPYSLLRRIGDPTAFEDWQSFALRANEDQRTIETFITSQYRKKGQYLYSDMKSSEGDTFVYVQLSDVGTPELIRFNLRTFIEPKDRRYLNDLKNKLFNPDVKTARTLLVIPPTVYSPAVKSHPQEDSFFMKEVMAGAKAFPWKDSDRALDLGTGSGYVMWLLWQAAKESGKEISYYAVDKNPLAVMAADINLVKIAGMPNLNLRNNDNLVAEDGQVAFLDGRGQPRKFDFVASNSPAYPLTLTEDSLDYLEDEGLPGLTRMLKFHSPATMTRLEILHDAGLPGAFFWVNFTKALASSLRDARSKAIVWNSLPRYDGDKLDVVMKIIGLIPELTIEKIMNPNGGAQVAYEIRLTDKAQLEDNQVHLSFNPLNAFYLKVTRQGRNKDVADYVVSDEFRQVTRLDLRQGNHHILDIGVGELPVTTIELSDSLKRINKSIQVDGMEIPSVLAKVHLVITDENILKEFKKQAKDYGVDNFPIGKIVEIRLIVGDDDLDQYAGIVKMVVGFRMTPHGEIWYLPLGIRPQLGFVPFDLPSKSQIQNQYNFFSSFINYLGIEQIKKIITQLHGDKSSAGWLVSESNTVSQSDTHSYKIKFEKDPVKNRLRDAGAGLIVSKTIVESKVKGLSLITANHVTIYMKADEKKQFKQEVADALAEGGVLTIKNGRTLVMGEKVKEIKLIDIYKRVNGQLEYVGSQVSDPGGVVVLNPRFVRDLIPYLGRDAFDEHDVKYLGVDQAMVSKANDVQFTKEMIREGLTYEQVKQLKKIGTEIIPSKWALWQSPVTARNFILLALDTIEGFKEAREAGEAGDIKKMAQLYRDNVIAYSSGDKEKYPQNGQLTFFYERGGLKGLLVHPHSYLPVTGSPSALLRLAFPNLKLIDPLNSEALHPLEVEKNYWSDPENIKYHVLQALDSIEVDRIKVFKKAREGNNIAVMAQLYMEYVKNYKGKRNGQKAFFIEIGGLDVLFSGHGGQGIEKIFSKVPTPSELVELAIPGLIDDKNPNALHSSKVKRRISLDQAMIVSESPLKLSYSQMQAWGLKRIGFGAQAEVDSKDGWPFVLKRFVDEPDDSILAKDAIDSYEIASKRLGGLVADFMFVDLDTDDGLSERAVVMRKVESPNLKEMIRSLLASGDIVKAKDLIERNVEFLLKISHRGVHMTDHNFDNVAVLGQSMLITDPGKLEESLDIISLAHFSNAFKQNYFYLKNDLGSTELADYYLKKMQSRKRDITNQFGNTDPVPMPDISSEVLRSLKGVEADPAMFALNDLKNLAEDILLYTDYESLFKGKKDRVSFTGLWILVADIIRSMIADIKNEEEYAPGYQMDDESLKNLLITFSELVSLHKQIYNSGHVLVGADESERLALEIAKVKVLLVLRQLDKNGLVKAQEMHFGLAYDYAVRRMPKLTEIEAFLIYLDLQRVSLDAFSSTIIDFGRQLKLTSARMQLDNIYEETNKFLRTSDRAMAGDPIPNINDLLMSGLNYDLAKIYWQRRMQHIRLPYRIWYSPITAKNMILVVLDENVDGFYDARIKNDIKKMAELYQAHVLGYKAKDRNRYKEDGQRTFYRENGLEPLLSRRRSYLANRNSPILLLQLALPQLLDPAETDALKKEEVENPPELDRAMLGDKIKGEIRSSKLEARSQTAPGGIDLTPDGMDIQTKGAMVPFSAPNLENIDIQGLTPFIFRMVPLTDVPAFLGLKENPIAPHFAADEKLPADKLYPQMSQVN